MENQAVSVDGCVDTGEMDAKLISKLDTRFNHRTQGQYWYQGVMYNENVSLEVLKGLPEKQYKPEDCLLVGYPKSGTTWLQEVAWLIRNDQDFTKCKEIPTSIRNPFLESPYTILVDNCPSPRILKSHIRPCFLPKTNANKEIKIIYILRNPKDVMVSYYHFYHSFSSLGHFSGTWEEFFDMFMSGYMACGSWFDHVVEWYPLFNKPEVCLIKYEDMKLKPVDSIRKLAMFLEKTPSDEDIDAILKYTSFDKMKNNPMTNFENVEEIDKDASPFMRKGCIGDWENYFTEEQNERLEQAMKQKLGHTDLTFTYC